MKIQEEVSVIEFTDTPGARYRTDGPYSGEQFREEHLEPVFEKNKNQDFNLSVNLDGTAGYATSFLEESFGGLARKISKETCKKHLIFISTEDPVLIEEIWAYIEDSSNHKKNAK
jgi:hypothetical protein